LLNWKKKESIYSTFLNVTQRYSTLEESLNITRQHNASTMCAAMSPVKARAEADTAATAAITIILLELLSRWHSSSSSPRVADPAMTAEAAAAGAAAQAKFFGHTCKAMLKNARVMLCVRFRVLNVVLFSFFWGGECVSA
jgi:hypothetical protein